MMLSRSMSTLGLDRVLFTSRKGVRIAMAKCIGCEREFTPERDDQLFCSDECRGWCKISIGSMVDKLKKDENIFSVFDHVQLLWKKEAQGGEGS